jgi:hypothetical protein
LRFIEDNWGTGRIGDQSFDARAGSLENMFDFSHPSGPALLLDPASGEPAPTGPHTPGPARPGRSAPAASKQVSIHRLITRRGARACTMPGPDCWAAGTRTFAGRFLQLGNTDGLDPARLPSPTDEGDI